MKSTRLIVTAVTLMLLLGSLAGAADSSEQGKWHFDLAVYAWLPTIEGDLGHDVPGGDDFDQSGCVDHPRQPEADRNARL